uniref:Uncharacterized protein n=1 Tax=Octactis speculum TaxID=3111310 RepID=A0A7S2DIP6_9STRA|mmetsp:Transcript_4982/g.6024  ORF Transcript_4982/g.6024 Transcript_4982/m.6024 type:complete len:162 (+) Transcript_4982:26-511(+)
MSFESRISGGISKKLLILAVIIDVSFADSNAVKSKGLGLGRDGSFVRGKRGNAQRKMGYLHGHQTSSGNLPSDTLANTDYTPPNIHDDNDDVFSSIEDRMRFRGGSETVTNRMRGLFALTYVAYIAIYFARKPMSVVKPVLIEEGLYSQQALGMVRSIRRC